MDKFGYVAYITGDLIRFGKGSNNNTASWTKLGEYALTTQMADGNVHKLKVIANDSNFKIYYDDYLIIDVNDTSYTNASPIGHVFYNFIAGLNPNIKSVVLSDLNNNLIYSNNFKSKIDNVIDKPAVHLPLETNATNVGFSALTINSVGSPTYTTIDGKKCIKFESGKYLTINSNNIFNLGTSSDFYIEFDFYPIKDRAGFILFCSGSSTANSNLFTITCAELFSNEYNKVYTYLGGTNYIFPGSFIYDSWNNLRIFRKGNITTYALNDLSISFNDDMTFNYASNSNLTYIGNAAYASTIYYNGYMSNFKMFVGTSEMPESYNDKKVLDLDFKPTRKSYLFKDNNDKCVIHPVNITQRDYQNSQYCCTFNGTNQYLQLGKNDLFNFGLDDFVIEFKFNYKLADNVTGGILLSSGNTSWTTDSIYLVIGASYNLNKVCFGIYNTSDALVATNTLTEGYNEVTLYRKDKILYLNVNGVTTINNGALSALPFNYNASSNTTIGKSLWTSGSSEIFKGSIYSIKVLRNTTNLILLEDTNVTTNIEYTLQNDTESQVISTTTKSNNIKLVKDETLLKLTVDDQSVELANTDITNTITLTNTENYNDLTIYDTNINEVDYLDKDTFMDVQFPELDIIEYDNPNLISVSTENFGYDTYQGFLEGYTDRLFKIIHIPSNSVLFEGYDDYDIKYMDINYITEYQILDIATSEMYPLMQNMEKGYIAGSFNNQLCKIENVDLYIKVRRSDNYRMIGIYKLINSQYRIDNLDINSEYDIELFDNNKIIESLLLTRRKPVTI